MNSIPIPFPFLHKGTHIAAPLLSLGRLHNGLVGTKEFKTPSSAPLIAPVVTITPLPLLYHVRTFYIVRYTFLKTHPSQHTYTFNELQLRKKKKKQKRGKRRTTHTQDTKQDKSQHKKIVIIRIVTIPKSITNIQIHYFKTTFHILNTLSTYKYITSKQHSCVQGPLRECLRAGRFRASFLLHTTCVRSCCN